MLWVLIYKVGVTEYARSRCEVASYFDRYLLDIIMINTTDADLAFFFISY